MGIFKNYINQTRKPEGFLGKIMIKGMNSGHAKMADWDLDHLKIASPKEVIDIGCGGGRNAGELLKKFPQARVTAIDYSPLAVKQATEYNKSEVSSGRCIVMQADVSALNLDEGRYGLATAFETIYFWPGLEKCFAEVARILKHDGYFLIVNESNGLDATSQKFDRIIEGMKIYTAEQIESALKDSGFNKVQTYHHKHKSWIAVLATK